MKNIVYMKEELERLDIKVELLKDVSIVSLYDNELEKTVCYATIDDREKLYVHIPYVAMCTCNFYKSLSIEALKTEQQANTKKSVKKLALDYAKARNAFLQTCKDCKSTLQHFNKTIDDFRQIQPEYKVKEFAYMLKKELDEIVFQTYNINKLGE